MHIAPLVRVGKHEGQVACFPITVYLEYFKLVVSKYSFLLHSLKDNNHVLEATEERGSNQ